MMIKRNRKGMTRFTPEQQAEHDKKIIADFDRRFPVGSRIWFWTSLPSGPVLETTIQRGAFVARSGDVVCFLDNFSGFVSIWFVQEIDESRRADLQFVEARRG